MLGSPIYRFAGEEIAQETQCFHQDIDVGICEQLKDLIGSQALQNVHLDLAVRLERQVLATQQSIYCTAVKIVQIFLVFCLLLQLFSQMHDHDEPLQANVRISSYTRAHYECGQILISYRLVKVTAPIKQQ